MTTSYDQVQAGWTVYGSDGEKIGGIEEVGSGYVLVTKGLIFQTDIYVPEAAITSVDASDASVTLNVPKDDIEGRGWSEPPVGGDADDVRSDASVDGLGYTGRDQSATGTFDTDTESTDSLRVPVREESLRAERRQEQAGEVRVEKNVVEEQRTIDVPVTHDEVQVRRVATDRSATSDDAFKDTGDTIRVPVTAERVEVTKEPRVVEEIEISKRPVTETERVSGTVRREEVEIEDDSMLSGVDRTGYGDDDRSGR